MVPGPQAWEEAGRGVWWGKKAESISRARRMVHGAGDWAAHVCVLPMRVCASCFTCTRVRRGDGGGAAGDNEGDEREQRANE